MKINQKDLDKIVNIANLAGRYNELQRLDGRVASALTSRRKSIIKNQLAELLGDKKEKETEDIINIRIEIPNENEKSSKEKKETSFSLAKLLGKKFEEDEGDDKIVVSFGDVFDEDTRGIIKKIVTEI